MATRDGYRITGWSPLAHRREAVEWAEARELASNRTGFVSDSGLRLSREGPPGIIEPRRSPPDESLEATTGTLIPADDQVPELPSHESVSEKRPPNPVESISLFFLWAAATDPEVISKLSYAEMVRYTSLGATVWFSTATVGGSVALVCSSSGLAWPLSLGGAISASSLVMALERNQAANAVNSRTWARRLTRVIVTIAITLTMAYFIATPIVVRIFSSEIGQVLATQRQERIVAYQRSALLSPSLLAAQADYTQAQGAVIDVERRYRAEVAGTGSGKPENGPIAQARKADVANALEYLQDSRNRLTATRAQIVQQAKYSATLATGQDTGYLQQLAALDVVQARSPRIAVAFRALVCLLTVLIAMPSLLAAFAPFRQPTSYEKLMKLRQDETAAEVVSLLDRRRAS